MTAPSHFGRYEVLFRIAAGGMAEVYAGCNRGEAGFARLVAIKRMLPHLADDARFVDMFLDEARVAAMIISPHVVQTIDLGRADDGAPYIVMDLVVGVTLAEVLRASALIGQPMPVGIAVEILAQAAQGLHDAHEAQTPAGNLLGIVHRDISPQNVLVGIDGRARVTDFGVAHALQRRTQTEAGTIKGKAAYFSPEQAEGRPLDRRSDVFAMGVVAWETLAGRRLFTSAEGTMAILELVRRMAIPDVRAVRPDIGPELADVVTRVLDRDRDRRHQSALELAVALREAGRTAGEFARYRDVAKYVQTICAERVGAVRDRIERALADHRISVPSIAAPPDTDPTADERARYTPPTKIERPRAPDTRRRADPGAPTEPAWAPQDTEPEEVIPKTRAGETAMARSSPPDTVPPRELAGGADATPVEPARRGRRPLVLAALAAGAALVGVAGVVAWGRAPDPMHGEPPPTTAASGSAVADSADPPAREPTSDTPAADAGALATGTSAPDTATGTEQGSVVPPDAVGARTGPAPTKTGRTGRVGGMELDTDPATGGMRHLGGLDEFGGER